MGREFRRAGRLAGIALLISGQISCTTLKEAARRPNKPFTLSPTYYDEDGGGNIPLGRRYIYQKDLKAMQVVGYRQVGDREYPIKGVVDSGGNEAMRARVFYLDAYRHGLLRVEGGKAVDAPKRKVRNTIIDEWIALADEHYYNQMMNLQNGKILSGAPSTIAIWGNAVTTKESDAAKAFKALGLGAGDFTPFGSAGLFALIKRMDANRAAIHKEILLKRRESVAVYPLSAVERDILRYWRAGSITFAIEGLEKTVEGEKEGTETR